MSIGTGPKLTLQEVAQQFRVDVRTVRNWTRRKDHPLMAWKVGRLVYTTPEALDAFARPIHEEESLDPHGAFATAEDAKRNAAALARLKAKFGR